VRKLERASNVAALRRTHRTGHEDASHWNWPAWAMIYLKVLDRPLGLCCNDVQGQAAKGARLARKARRGRVRGIL